MVVCAIQCTVEMDSFFIFIMFSFCLSSTRAHIWMAVGMVQAFRFFLFFFF